MIGRVLIAIGLLVAVAGIVFSLQGFGVIGGSAMSGSSFWSAAGPIVAIGGLLIAAAGLYRLKARPQRL
jgi:hypothetical protein